MGFYLVTILHYRLYSFIQVTNKLGLTQFVNFD